ncbi:MAG: MCE family protein [Verrucomicrobia bacterium]|nr:MCE family protein [Verrucomicrobiota bacterium]
MSQKANPTLIGAFVLGAILIAVGVIIFFGSADLFTKKATYVTFFGQSVSGLSVGSNVKFKGVTIGKVTSVLINYLADSKQVYIKVYYQVDSNLVVQGTDAEWNLFDPAQHKARLERGLRAKLDFESLISGQLFVGLDYYPNAGPPHLVQDHGERALQIPAQPSDIDAILGNLTKAIGNLGNIDFLTLAKDVQSLIVSAREGIDELNLKELGSSLTETSNALKDLFSGGQVKDTLTAVHQSFDQLNTTLKKITNEIDPLTKNLNPTLAEAKKTMGSLEKATTQLNQILKPSSGLRYQLDSSLSQISSAAASIERLSEFLQRHPNSLIFGRKPSKQEQP